MRAIAIIPARYHSVRFPGKLLALLKGKPVIQYVFENAVRSREVERVIIATDHDAVYTAVRAFGGDVVMTAPELSSGTDRVAEVVKGLGSDVEIIVNVQGDEPLLTPDMIDLTVTLLKDSDAHIGTLAKKIDDEGDIFDPNVVKVVFNAFGDALYFSRAAIPYYRDRVSGPGPGGGNVGNRTFYKHIGIYSFRKDALLRLTALPQSPLEKAEKLEQLRALENGYTIRIGVAERDTIGVDTPGDMEKVEKWLNLYS